jgi:hypothetical protein
MTNQLKPMRYTDEELQLINNVFAGRKDLFILLRKFFLQGELNEQEIEGLKIFVEPKLLAVLKKTFMPEIDLNTPLGEIVDLWINIPTKGVSLDDFAITTETIRIVSDYLAQRFAKLTGEVKDEIRFKDLEYSKEKDTRQFLIDLGARNTILAQIEMNLMQIFILAGQCKETFAQLIKRLQMNSNK